MGVGGTKLGSLFDRPYSQQGPITLPAIASSKQALAFGLPRGILAGGAGEEVKFAKDHLRSALPAESFVFHGLARPPDPNRSYSSGPHLERLLYKAPVGRGALPESAPHRSTHSNLTLKDYPRSRMEAG